MVYKIFKITLILIIIIVIMSKFSASFSSQNIDNLVQVVAIGIDKNTSISEPNSSSSENSSSISDNSTTQNSSTISSESTSANNTSNIKVSFQFVNTSGLSEGSSSEQSSTIVTSISASTINEAIALMNSYIGKELNFSHCKVIVFSEEFAREGLADEICTLINNQEIRPSTNIVITTSEANTYLKNANPNIEKLITSYYDTFELTSNFTGYSADTNLGNFYTNMFSSTGENTAILGRTFKSESNSEGETNSSTDNKEGSSSSSSSVSATSSESEAENSSGSSESQSENSSNPTKQQPQNDPNSNQSEHSGKNTGRDTDSNSSSGGTLDISGKRKTQNVGIAVFKDDKYVGQLSAIDSICHLLITNNVYSSVISVPSQNVSNNFLDLTISPSKKTKILIDTSSDIPNICISVFCNAKVLTIDTEYNYESSNTLEEFSSQAEHFLKENIESYLKKTSKEFKSDIACFGKYALKNFLTTDAWENYKWLNKYEKANFNVDVDINISSSLIFSGQKQ